MEPIEVPGTLDALEPLAAFIKEAARLAGLSSKQAYGLRLAVDEVATNIATHGYEENGKTGMIRARIELTPDELLVILEDDSPAFDPRTLLDHGTEVMAQDPAARKLGGLGIHLVARSVDRFDYRHVNGCNQNHLGVRRPRA